LVRDTIRQGRIEGEFHFRTKEKGTFPGYLSTSVIKEGDRVGGVVIVVADLTRLYEVETRLKQSEKLAALGKVVEGVAHEVRNCLTSLGGFALRVRKITLDNPDCNNFTKIILDDVARLEAMVRQIEEYVHFSKFYSFQFRQVSVPEVIVAAQKRVLSKLHDNAVKRISFRLQADKDLPRIVADPGALEEIFYNLIVNAYEAMPSGGTCTVVVKSHTTAVSVAVTDTGMGMREEIISDIFNPFFTSKTSGAGMGLSKVYLLVEEYGGTINVKSQPDKGSTFEVVLPVERLMTGLLTGKPASAGREVK
jgi:signal transduction histidine kinase